MYQNRINKILDSILDKNPEELACVNIYHDLNKQHHLRKIKAVFPLAFVLHSIVSLSGEYRSKKLIKYIDRLVEYLESESKGKYSFNYWVREDPLSSQYPLPDDLDDSALCISALAKANIHIHENYILKIIKLETSPGGPYYTWYLNLCSENINKWADVDPVINSHLLYAMALCGIRLKATEQYILDCLREGQISSSYYPYDLIFYFYTSKYISIYNSNKLKDLLLRKLSLFKKSWSILPPTEKLLLLLSQAYLEEKIDQKMIDEVLAWKGNDGRFPELAICYDFAEGNNHTYAYSEFAVSALVMELLAKIDSQIKQTKRSKKLDVIDQIAEDQLQMVRERIEKSSLNQILPYSVVLDTNITPLRIPLIVFVDLRIFLSPRNKAILITLSSALFFGWFAYNTMDDIIDGQKGTGELPAALELTAISWDYFSSLVKDFEFFRESLIVALSQCHSFYNSEHKQEITSHKDFAVKISPFLTTIQHMPKFFSLEANIGNNLRAFFQHVYSINQLSDDSHDWEEDIQSGRQTYITYLISKHKGKMESNQKIFWNYVMPEVIKLCEQEYSYAKKALKGISLSNGYMRKYLEASITPVRHAKEESARVKHLLNAFT